VDDASPRRVDQVNRLLELVREFRDDDRGQATTEYILILALVVTVATRFKGNLSKRIDAVTTALFGQIDSAVQNDGG
jgi:Flp pilus assembly pilin Flp